MSCRLVTLEEANGGSDSPYPSCLHRMYLNFGALPEHCTKMEEVLLFNGIFYVSSTDTYKSSAFGHCIIDPTNGSFIVRSNFQLFKDFSSIFK
jgi:hypothetical protein